MYKVQISLKSGNIVCVWVDSLDWKSGPKHIESMKWKSSKYPDLQYIDLSQIDSIVTLEGPDE